MASNDDRATHHVQSLERGLAVIAAFDAEHPELTLTEVAERTDLTRAAARRFLLTLVDLGYARRDGRQFSLTPRVLQLGYAYLATQPLPDIARPHLEKLVAEVHESSSVSVLQDDEIVYVARVAAAHRIMTVSINVGTRFPAHVTSMGRVLLAALPEPELDALLQRFDFRGYTSQTITDPRELRETLRGVREQGWAFVDQELEEGLRSVAVPIHDHTGAVVAAANVSAHANRTGLRDVRQHLLPRLREAVEGIEQDLAMTRPRQRAAN